MNLKLLNSLEKDLNESLRKISKDTFLEKFVKLNLAEKYLQDEDEIIDLLDNLDKIAPQLKTWTTTMRSKLILRKTEVEIEDCFLEYNLNKNDKLLDSKLQAFISNGDALISLSGIICSLISKRLSVAELSKKYNENIGKVLGVLKNLDEEKFTYELRCDILDLVIQCGEYIKMSGGSVNEIIWLDDELTKLHEFEFNVFEKGEIPELSMKPEELGLIDITRLKKGKGE